jgi:hypothetical protein
MTICRSAYPVPSARPAGVNASFHSIHNHPVGPFHYNATPAVAHPGTSFRTLHAKQEQVFASHSIYQSQLSMARHFPWPAVAHASSRVPRSNLAFNMSQQRSAQNRARSVDPGHRRNPPVLPSHVRQLVPTTQHYQARPQPLAVPKNINGSPTEQAKEPAVSAVG